jgi:hypothetical protein
VDTSGSTRWDSGTEAAYNTPCKYKGRDHDIAMHLPLAVWTSTSTVGLPRESKILKKVNKAVNKEKWEEIT